jgi:hypothetical protein
MNARPIVVLAAALLLLPGATWAVTIHIYPGDSIQEDGIDEAVYGDLVLVHVEPYGSWTWEEAITLKTGVDLKSVAGSDQTFIDVSDLDPEPATAVYGDGREDLEFGAVVQGAGHGFTVQGGTDYGLQLDGCSNVDVADIIVETDASGAGISSQGCDQTVSFLEVHVDMQSAEPDAGWLLDGCSLQDCSVQNVDAFGIWTEGPALSSTFEDVTISSCDVGVYAEDISLDWEGGDVSHCTSTGVDVEEWEYSAGITLTGVNFDNCGTALVAYATQSRSVPVEVADCDFTGSDYGVELTRAEGFVKSCDFVEIGATGLTVSDYTDELDIGYPNEGNTFSIVDGTGIELDSGARVAIVDNEFDRVLGTGILCNTGAADTIDACDLDGFDAVVPEYSYEGIHTEGSGTAVRIRNSDLRDYDDEPSPTPRAVYVHGYSSGATADLGRNLPLGQWGYNDFRNSGIDVYYTGIVAQGQPIPDLYAQRNYWGGEDPWLGGTWKDYVIWEPDLDSPPGAPPAGGDLSSGPGRVALGDVRPNPAIGRVHFSYELPGPGAVEVALWDLCGHRIKTLIREDLPAGSATVQWDGADEGGDPVACGEYVCRLKSPHGQATRRFVFMR